MTRLGFLVGVVLASLAAQVYAAGAWTLSP